MSSFFRPLQQAAQFVAEAVLLFIFGAHRVAKAVVTGGDVYDAKVIAAGDISDLGAHRVAVAWLSRLIAKNPLKPRAYFERGMAYLELANKQAAAADFKECMSISPTFPGAKDWYEKASR